jgi:hypothetical protein
MVQGARHARDAIVPGFKGSERDCCGEALASVVFKSRSFPLRVEILIKRSDDNALEV